MADPAETAAGRLRAMIAAHPELAFLLPQADAAGAEAAQLRGELAACQRALNATGWEVAKLRLALGLDPMETEAARG